MNQNRCVCCGELIPEGRQVCWLCANGRAHFPTARLAKQSTIITIISKCTKRIFDKLCGKG